MQRIISKRKTSSQLPPGPRTPAAWQTIATWARPTASLERARKHYGKRFTMRFLGQPPFVVLSDPEEIKQVFQAAPDVLHPGEGVSVLEPIVGRNSVILLDEDAHMEQRKLMLPAFHGERMQQTSELMVELAERELARWPRDEPIKLHPRMQRVTLEIILRVVFGLEQGERLDALRELLTELLAFAESPVSLLPFVQRALAGHGPQARFERLYREVDRRLFELIEERRAGVEGHAGGDPGVGSGEDVLGSDGPEQEDRNDVLGMLLVARHEDGSPMSAQELRDELMTALVAGHETTASQLAWAFECLAHEQAVSSRLTRELDEGAGDAYLTATIQEALRLKPVLPQAEPRVVKRTIEVGGVRYPPGVALFASVYLLHHDPDIYPRPYTFRPERFLEESGGRAPQTYTWIPFGGGRRRCLGASFALLEMKIVLRAVLSRCELLPVRARRESARMRSITLSPSGGCEVILRERCARRGDRSSGRLVAASS